MLLYTESSLRARAKTGKSVFIGKGPCRSYAIGAGQAEGVGDPLKLVERAELNDDLATLAVSAGVNRHAM